MIHAEFNKGERYSKVMFDTPMLSPSEDFLEMLADQMGTFEEAIRLTNTLRQREEELAVLSKYSDRIQLSITLERVQRVPEEQSISDYEALVVDDLLELHDIFRDLVREAIQELENPYPRIFLRH